MDDIYIFLHAYIYTISLIFCLIDIWNNFLQLIVSQYSHILKYILWTWIWLWSVWLLAKRQYINKQRKELYDENIPCSTIRVRFKRDRDYSPFSVKKWDWAILKIIKWEYSINEWSRTYQIYSPEFYWWWDQMWFTFSDPLITGNRRLKFNIHYCFDTKFMAIESALFQEWIEIIRRGILWKDIISKTIS